MGASTRAFTLGAKAGRSKFKETKLTNKAYKAVGKTKTKPTNKNEMKAYKKVNKMYTANAKAADAQAKAPITVAGRAGYTAGFHSNKIAIGSAAGIGAATTTTRNKHRRVAQ